MDCVVPKNMESFKDFLQKGTQFENSVSSLLSPCNGRITTITCFIDVDTNVPFQRLVELSQTSEWDSICAQVGKPFQIRVPGERKNSRRKHRSFYNSISIVYKEDTRTICVKTFRTGLHITGCNTFEKCVDAFESVCYLIWAVTDVVLTAKTCDVQLVNVLLNYGKDLDLNELCEVYTKNGLNCLYDREAYCGLRVKVVGEHGNTCTSLLFPSGKMMFTGLKHECDIETIYNKVLLGLECNSSLCV